MNMSNVKNVVEVEKIRKNFGGKIVLNDVSFNVRKGEIFALVGPNGAGKTTTLRCIFGDLNPDEGEIRIFGSRLNSKIKMRMAVMNEGRETFRRLTGQEYIKIWSNLYPNWNDKLMSSFVLHYGLDLRERVERYSLGMKTIFMLGLIISSSSDLLILDEPTHHIDPEIRMEMLQVLRDYTSHGDKTIIISSHEIYELEEITTSFAIMKEGKIIYSDSIDEAKTKHRIVGKDEKVHKGEIIGILNDEYLLRVENTNTDVGRYPTFREIVLGYLRGKVSFKIFET